MACYTFFANWALAAQVIRRLCPGHEDNRLVWTTNGEIRTAGRSEMRRASLLARHSHATSLPLISSPVLLGVGRIDGKRYECQGRQDWRELSKWKLCWGLLTWSRKPPRQSTAYRCVEHRGQTSTFRDKGAATLPSPQNQWAPRNTRRFFLEKIKIRTLFNEQRFFAKNNGCDKVMNNYD